MISITGVNMSAPSLTKLHASGLDLGLCEALKAYPHIPADKIRALARDMSVLEIGARKGLFIADGGANQVYVVLRGAIKVIYVSHLLATVLSPGDVFGLCNLIPEGPRLLRYVAMRDSAIGRIAPENFVRTAFDLSLDEFALMVDFVLGRWWAGRVVQHTALCRLPLRSRLLQALGDLSAKFGVEDSRGTIINLPLTHSDLAELVGSSRPQATTQLASLAASGAVVRDGRRFILVKNGAPRRTSRSLGNHSGRAHSG
jgi:CRP/FNR family transcriptional regulator, cyclic AMP receptor protein